MDRLNAVARSLDAGSAADEVGSVDRLRATIAAVRSHIERNAEISSQTPAGRTSEFWTALLRDRSGYPDINGMMVFRRAGHAYGVGDDRQGNEKREREYCARMHHIFRRMVSAEFVARLSESAFGSPFVYEHDGIVRSASFWINAATTYRVTDFIRRFGKRGPLRVLEIGAGWGACVHQLHDAVDVESCAIVDLPENLYLSTIYLSNALPDRRLELVDARGPVITAIRKRTLVACLPATIERLRTTFDLILNSFSLQEMALESVRAYLEWIETVLADDGIFVSLNAHAKAGVRNPSDYGFGRFHIHHWGVFRKSPPGFLNTIPYEVVLGRRSLESPVYDPSSQDALGWLIQLGLDDDLQPLCTAFAAGSLDQGQERLLSAYNQFFAAETDTARERSLAALERHDGSAIWPYISAHQALVTHDYPACGRLIAEACSRGLGGFARIRAEVMLAALERKNASRLASLLRGGEGERAALQPVDGLDIALAYPEAAAIASTGDLGPMIDQTNRLLRRN